MSQRFRCDVPEERRTGLAAALAAVRRGALVVIPADNFYAVVTDAFRNEATTALRQAKGRPANSPLTVFVGQPTTVEGVLCGITNNAREYMAALWPGPLTLLGRSQPALMWDIDASGKVGVRMPLHPVALELLRGSGPLASSAANYAGMSPPRTCEAAQEQLGNSIAVYLDAGELTGKPASAVVDVSTDPPHLLRQGDVELAHLQRICPEVIVEQPE